MRATTCRAYRICYRAYGRAACVIGAAPAPRLLITCCRAALARSCRFAMRNVERCITSLAIHSAPAKVNMFYRHTHERPPDIMPAPPRGRPGVVSRHGRLIFHAGLTHSTGPPPYSRLFLELGFRRGAHSLVADSTIAGHELLLHHAPSKKMRACVSRARQTSMGQPADCSAELPMRRISLGRATATKHAASRRECLRPYQAYEADDDTARLALVSRRARCRGHQSPLKVADASFPRFIGAEKMRSREAALVISRRRPLYARLPDVGGAELSARAPLYRSPPFYRGAPSAPARESPSRTRARHDAPDIVTSPTPIIASRPRHQATPDATRRAASQHE